MKTGIDPFAIFAPPYRHRDRDFVGLFAGQKDSARQASVVVSEEVDVLFSALCLGNGLRNHASRPPGGATSLGKSLDRRDGSMRVVSWDRLGEISTQCAFTTGGR